MDSFRVGVRATCYGNLGVIQGTCPVELKATFDELEGDVSVVLALEYQAPVVKQPPADWALCKEDLRKWHVSDIF